jgi:hypothetical protein
MLACEHHENMKDKKRPMTVAQLAKLGAAARNRALTPEQRSQIAKRAAKVRWAKRDKRRFRGRG